MLLQRVRDQFPETMLVSAGQNKSLTLWNATTGSVLNMKKNKHWSSIKSLIRLGVDCMCVGYGNGMIESVKVDFNRESEKWEVMKTGELKGHEKSVWGLDSSSRQNMVLSGGLDWVLKLWRHGRTTTTSYKNFEEVAKDQLSSLNTANSSKNDYNAFSSRWKEEEKLTTSCVHTFQDHSNAVYSVRFLGEGNAVASSSISGEILLHNIEKLKLLRCFKYHTMKVFTISSDEDGQLLFSVSMDGHLKLFDLRQQKVVGDSNVGIDPHTTPKPKTYDMLDMGYNENGLWGYKQPRRNLKGLLSLFYRPNSHTIVVGEGGHRNSYALHNIDKRTFKPVVSQSAHKGRIYRIVSVSNDGSVLCTCSTDRNVKMWDVDTLKEKKTQSQMKEKKAVNAICCMGNRARVAELVLLDSMDRVQYLLIHESEEEEIMSRTRIVFLGNGKEVMCLTTLIPILLKS